MLRWLLGKLFHVHVAVPSPNLLATCAMLTLPLWPSNLKIPQHEWYLNVTKEEPCAQKCVYKTW